MAKKTKAAAPGHAKRRKGGGAPRKPAPKRPSADRVAVARGGATATIRRLRTQLARALARIDELQALAETDFLLDILNRRGFERALQRAVSYIKRYQANAALILIDVDRLKPINDTFGHAAGDQVLKAVVAALSRHVRASDIIGRLGGDEFALLLWNLSETDARAKAALLEQGVDHLSFTFNGRTVTAGASAGVVLLDARADHGRAMEAADSAMYLRKAQRRHER